MGMTSWQAVKSRGWLIFLTICLIINLAFALADPTRLNICVVCCNAVAVGGLLEGAD